MAAADLVQFRRLLVDIDLEFGNAATTPAAARPGMSPPITAIRSGAVKALCDLPVRQRLVRLRDRRIHDLAVLTGAGGQFDDIAVGIAEIDRPDKTVVDRPANLSTLGLGLLQHRVERLGLQEHRAAGARLSRCSRGEGGAVFDPVG
jgi:hypothetical protein